MKPSILLVGAGRRFSFVERLLEKGFNVAAYEVDKYAPISQICPMTIGTTDWNEAREKIKTTVKEWHGYDYILPLNDQATYELANEPLVIGHDKVVSSICYDKINFQNFMRLHFPYNYPTAHHDDDLIIKPRYGASSKGIRFDRWKYESWIAYDTDTEVVQRKIEGEEFSVDAYWTRRGEFVGAIPRTRERVAGGEVIDSRIVYNKDLIDITHTIGSRLSMTGPACFQYIIERGTGKLFLFEINARLGGGNILSLEAGFDMIDMMRQEYWLEELNPYHSEIQWGLYMRRINREVFFHHEVLRTNPPPR